MRVGELASRSGLAPSAVRYYEQVGLLPVARRSSAGYRVYADDAVDRLDFIRAAQAVGLTLAEVRQILGVRDAGEPPCRVVIDLVERRHAEVRTKITELRRLERDLAAVRARASTLSSRDCDPSGICHVIPGVERPGALTPT